MSRTYTYFITLVGLVCVFFITRLLFFTDLSTRSVPSDVFQGILIGFGLAVVTVQVYGKLTGAVIKTSGWTTMYGCGEPGNSMLFRATQALVFVGPVNIPVESMYWFANADGAGRTLSGAQSYVMHFPAGQLPPNDAFWSLTMGDAKNRFVPNSLKRYTVGDHSGLVLNADGSVDIYIQKSAPAGHESNWLPAPTGNFILWLRVYMPGAAILNREYKVPPVVKTT